MRLVLAVMQSADLDPLLRELAALGVAATQIHGDAATSRAAITALAIGVADEGVGEVVGIIHSWSRSRLRQVEPMRVVGERAAFWLPIPFEQTAGGATVYVLPIRRFERIGYA